MPVLIQHCLYLSRSEWDATTSVGSCQGWGFDDAIIQVVWDWGQALSLVGAAKLLKDLGCPMTLSQLRDCDGAAQSRVTQTLLARLSRSQPPPTDQR